MLDLVVKQTQELAAYASLLYGGQQVAELIAKDAVRLVLKWDLKTLVETGARQVFEAARNEAIVWRVREHIGATEAESSPVTAARVSFLELRNLVSLLIQRLLLCKSSLFLGGELPTFAACRPHRRGSRPQPRRRVSGGFRRWSCRGGRWGWGRFRWPILAPRAFPLSNVALGRRPGRLR